MKEYGTVTAVHGRKAQVTIARSAMCGDCGACQVGRSHIRGAQAQHSTLRAAPKARIKALADNGSDPCAGQRNRHSR